MKANLNSNLSALLACTLAFTGSAALADSAVPAPVPAPATVTTPTSTAASGSSATADAPPEKIERMILKPGKSLSINMATEDIICTNDVELARKQRDSYPDSPEAGFIYAVALSRTSHVEDALREVRRARKLAEKQGGPSYFDKMVETYEKMLTYYPEDNQVRYHLAWAYYMKAYVLAKYSHQAAMAQAPYKQWVAPPETKSPETKSDAAKTETTSAETKTDATSSPGKVAMAIKTDAKVETKVDETKVESKAEDTDVLKNIHKASNTISNASPQAIPQVQKYYSLAMSKLDDLLQREPGDVWARVYRAFLRAESTGDLATSMTEWQKVRDEQPSNPAAYFFLGEGYLKQGNLKECLSNVSKAIALRAVGN